MSTGGEAMFALNGVTKRYGAVTALRAIDLRVDPGERVALVGPSGAGKSTLLGLLNGSILASEGVVGVMGRDVARLSRGELRRIQRRIGTIYQQLHLVDSLRVIHNVNAGHLGRWSLARAALSLVWPQAVPVAAAALTRVGIPEKLYARTDELSGGQQQRVAIARVLVQAPSAILADEPISSLDPERGREVVELLCDLSRRDGTTLVASLHAVVIARSHFDRIVGLRDGAIVFDRPAGSVEDGMVERLYEIHR